VAFKKFVEKYTKPVDELDRRDLATWCDSQSCTAIADLVPRRPARVAGEVRSVRIVPRAGADALEVTVNDGRNSVTGVFLGRRKIGGLTPGRRVVLEGIVAEHDHQRQIYNPIYTLC
jgi:RecG-like helicase